MGSGLFEAGLVIFTTLAPSGIVAFVVVAITIMVSSEGTDVLAARCHALMIPIAFVLVGLTASATQLGTPANALNVFRGIGRSPLSNEVFSSVVFLALSGVFWLYSFKLKVSRRLAKVWLGIACVSGCTMLVMISRAYSFFTIPVWDSPYTPVNLLLSAFVGGIPLALLTLGAQGETVRRGWALAAGGVSVAATVCCTVFMLLEHAWLSSVENGVVAASDLVPAYIPMTVAFCVISLVGIALSIGPALPTSASGIRVRHTRLVRIVGLACVFLGIGIARVVFYGLWMTIGL